MAFQATTGVGVAAKIISAGNQTAKTVPGYNGIRLSLSGVNGPTTFQLNPVIEDAFGTPITSGTQFTLTAVAAGSIGILTLTSVAASANGQAVYTGTITGGGSNAFEGDTFTIAGFTNASNNGFFLVAASTTTTVTLVNASAVAETHAATATPLQGTAVFTGTFTGAGTALVISSVAASSGGNAVYTGSIAGGGSNALVGQAFVVTGFTGGNTVNNGTFVVTASTLTTLTLNNPNAVAVTAAGTATSTLAGQTFVITGFANATNNGTFIVVSSTGTTITVANGATVAETHAGTATLQESVATLPSIFPVVGQLGIAASYELLASSGITNTGSSVITGGNIGSSPTATYTGFPPGTFTAPAFEDSADAAAAQTALAAAIVHYQGVTPTLSGLSNLSTGGNGSTSATYTAGNYFGASSLTMPTGIILDAQGNPNAVFVFVAGSTINLASGQTVALINGAQAGNVVFVAGSSYTSVATSTMNGNVLAAVSATLGGGVQNGRVLANTGAITIAAATTATTPLATSSPISTPGNALTYIEYGFKTLTGNTYLPSGTPTQIVTVSSTGLITAVALGEGQVETSYPTFNNSIGDIVSPGNIMNGTPINKIYAENRVKVLV